ncbi:unnamed protein product [Choristocarpus tenellus]
MAVRVCTDCHISLETVTVAASRPDESSKLTPPRGGGNEIGDGSDGAIGRGIGEAADESDVYGSFSVSKAWRQRGGKAIGSRFADGNGVLIGEIENDVVLADVLEWGRVQRRGVVVCQVLRMCAAAVVVHHYVTILQAALRVLDCFVYAAASSSPKPPGRGWAASAEGGREMQHSKSSIPTPLHGTSGSRASQHPVTVTTPSPLGAAVATASSPMLSQSAGYVGTTSPVTTPISSTAPTFWSGPWQEEEGPSAEKLMSWAMECVAYYAPFSVIGLLWAVAYMVVLVGGGEGGLNE